MPDDVDIILTYPLDGQTITKDVVANADVRTLMSWYDGLCEHALQVGEFIDAHRKAQVDDDEYYRRSAGALAYYRIARKWVENQPLTLGVCPPYQAADPRNRQIRELAEKLKRVTADLKKVAPEMVDG